MNEKFKLNTVYCNTVMYIFYFSPFLLYFFINEWFCNKYFAYLAWIISIITPFDMFSTCENFFFHNALFTRLKMLSVFCSWLFLYYCVRTQIKLVKCTSTTSRYRILCNAYWFSIKIGQIYLKWHGINFVMKIRINIQ